MAHGAELLPAPVDESGIVVDALTSKSKGGLKLVFVTPSHQFPTGVTLTLARRLDLLCWAEKTGAMIVEDDYDSEFRFGSRPIPSLQGLATGDSVMYVGTILEVFFPLVGIG